jgi:hypothetical protein
MLERYTGGTGDQEGCTEIVNYDINDLIFSEDERMRVFSIYCWVCRIFACGHGCVYCRNFRGNVGDVVEEGAGSISIGTSLFGRDNILRLSVTEIAHDDI